MLVGEETEGVKGRPAGDPRDQLEATAVTQGKVAAWRGWEVPAVWGLNIVWRESHEDLVAE